MLLASNVDILLLTTSSTSAEKVGLPACLEEFWWALFGMMNRCHLWGKFADGPHPYKDRDINNANYIYI